MSYIEPSCGAPRHPLVMRISEVLLDADRDGDYLHLFAAMARQAPVLQVENVAETWDAVDSYPSCCRRNSIVESSLE